MLAKVLNTPDNEGLGAFGMPQPLSVGETIGITIDAVDFDQNLPSKVNVHDH